MNHRFPFLRFLQAGALVLLPAVTGPAAAQMPPDGPPPGGPPPQVFAACAGKATDAACQFHSPRGLENGTCRTMGPGDFVCVPANPPPFGGPRGNGAGGMGGGPSVGYVERGPNPIALPLANRLPDTGQETCFDDRAVIDCPARGQPFFGQDASYRGRGPSYRVNGDGTVSDLVTGLVWQKAHHPQRLPYDEARAACESLTLGGRRDWRLPGIKELYSIADFRGITGRRFFLDPAAFDLAYPDASILAGDRFAATHHVEMMGQTWSSTLYSGVHGGRPGVEAAFFFNFLDGRIKQAPTRGGPTLFYRCVRGAEWGGNAFRDNGDGSVTDAASGLMWQQADDGRGRPWPEALAACNGLTLAEHRDWRLPNAKELLSIVDYRRNDPALDVNVFRQRDPAAWFWSSTTFGDSPREAVYVCFGKCLAADGTDLHGAGAQRSDPKTGDPARFAPRGGQRDQVRINNHVRCVRDAG